MNLRAAIRTARALIGAPRPVILYHKPTARCDCRCRFCDFWTSQPDHDDVIASERILAVIDRAAVAGMAFYTAWGGEPLLVPALPAWLAHARRRSMITTVCTAGLRLEERAAELAPHVDQLLLSLEAVGDEQDRIRRTPGLFAALVRGLTEYRRRGGGQVILWSNLSRANRDQLEPIARFAREHAIEVEFFPAALYSGYNEDEVLSPAERTEVFAHALELKRRGLPVLNSRYALELMGSGRPFTCNLARLAVQLDSAGRVWACEPRVIPGLEPYGDGADFDFNALPRSPAYRDARVRLASCNACLLPCVANMADHLVRQALRRSASQAYYRFQSRKEKY